MRSARAGRPQRPTLLICIQTWRDVVELPASVVGGTGTFPAGLKHPDVVSALDKAGCSWAPYPPLAFGHRCSLMAIPTGANFTCEIPEDEDPVLNVMGLPGVQWSARTRKDSGRKIVGSAMIPPCTYRDDTPRPSPQPF